MIVTEDSIRRALQSEARDAPDLAAIRAAAASRRSAQPQSRSNRRMFAVLGVAATVAVVVGASLLLTSNRHGTQRPHPSAATGHSSGFPVVFSFRVDPISDYVEMERDLTASRQSVIFGSALPVTAGGIAGAHQVARVDVYGAGQYDATAAQRGTPITVAGHPGYFAVVPVQLHDGSGDPPADLPAVVWQYAPDSWAVSAGLDATHQTETVELTFAQTVVVGANPVLLPAKMLNLPAGLTRDQVSIATIGDPATTGMTIYTVSFKLATTSASANPDYGFSMTIKGPAAPAQTSTSQNPAPIPSSTDPVRIGTVTAGGQQYTVSTVALADGAGMYVNSPNGRLSIDIGPLNAARVPVDIKWAQFVPAAALGSTATWFPAENAIP